MTEKLFTCYEANQTMNQKITLTVDGLTGTAEIKWITENQWNVAHYEAFISVQFQNGRWENLFVYDKEKLAEATKKAKQYLEMDLSRCTLCG